MKSIMKVKELKEILKNREDDDMISLFCHNDKAKLIIYYGKNKNLEKVIMEEHDF